MIAVWKWVLASVTYDYPCGLYRGFSVSLSVRSVEALKCNVLSNIKFSVVLGKSVGEENVYCVSDVLNSHQRLSVRMIADHVKIDKMAVHTVITLALHMRKICAKLF